MKWKHLFNLTMQVRGQQYYLQGRVKSCQKIDETYYLTVKGTKTYHVWIHFHAGEPYQMRCTCPHAKEGAYCKHMAASFFYLDAKKLLNIEDEYPISQISVNLLDFTVPNPAPTHTYFDCASMKKPFKLPSSDIQKVNKLIEDGKIKLNSVYHGYSGFEFRGSSGDTITGTATGTVIEKGKEHTVRLWFSQNMITQAECSASGCGRNYHHEHYLGNRNLCVHQTALLLLLERHILTNNPGDFTTRSAASFLNHYREQRYAFAESSAYKQEKPLGLTLKPRLQANPNDWQLSFKITGAKSYVVKDLEQLITQIENSEVVQFGTTTKWPLGIENFSESGKKYFHFLRQIVIEEKERKRAQPASARHYMDSYGTQKDSISLYGRRLDEFFDVAGDDVIELTQGYGREKKSTSLTCREQSPDVCITISNLENFEQKFCGIQITGSVPELIYTPKGAYFLDDAHLNHVPMDTLEHLKPLFDTSKNGDIHIQIGQKHLGEFYHHVLPKLREHLTIIEQNQNEIQNHLPPEITFAFFLDAEDHDLTCQAKAIYDEQQFSFIDIAERVQNHSPYLADTLPFTQSSSVFTGTFGLPRSQYGHANRIHLQGIEEFRDIDHEREALIQLQTLFPYTDSEQNCFRCNQDEEQIYRVLNGGIDLLLNLGEVHATERFKRTNIRRSSKVSVGVSVQSHLLDVNILSDDLSLRELHDVLESYRKKKKFHRLKNGDFFDLESEPETLELLSQLQASMKIPLRDFVKGHMQIPAYRALYLDKMLETCEGAYIHRDRNFKKLIKDFKTVADSDFEIPDTLQKTLRTYQATGYRWLKTLNAYGFGGILADDMGLGKTLQVITLLLSDRFSGPSIIVTPASLTYNWGAEFQKFAPQIKVGPVTGSLKERHDRIKNWNDYDVLVTSYDLLKRDIAAYEEYDCRFSYEILDEAQYIKNHTTAAAKAAKIIKSRQRFALTGTPIENRLSELWSIFDYLMPGYLYSYDSFKKDFETPIVKHHSAEAAQRLKRMVSPFIMRRLKGHVLKDLPDKLEEVRYVKADSEQQRLLDAQIAHMKQVLAQTDESDFWKNKIQILAELVKIRQICCDPSLCFENYNGGSAKREACMELIQTAIAGEHKLLVFSQFTSMLELLERDLRALGISYYKITGATPKQERLRLVNAYNQDSTPVFLISLKAGGTGLNLTGADMVIHYDPWWNLAVQNQATDRAHRIGQTKVVTVYKMIVKNSIEDRILQMQDTKQNLADEILSGENGQIGRMTKEELLSLLE